MVFFLAFPLENKEWTEYKVAWEDMNPVWSWNVGKINGRGGLTPGGIDFLGIGNKWKIGYFNAPGCRASIQHRGCQAGRRCDDEVCGS